MCGIFGYIGSENAADECLQGLRQLAYRGYDSAGIAGLSSGVFDVRKEPGGIASLEEALAVAPMRLDIAIAHTRWATHGKPTKENAHPHFDSSDRVAVVHNGIIENHLALRSELEACGVSFRSHTDTEVLAQLLAHLYEGNLLEAVQKAVQQIRGFWAVALIHQNHPDQIIAFAKECPLCIARDPLSGEVKFASDLQALARPGLEVLFLKQGEIACIRRGKIELYSDQLLPLSVNMEILNWSGSASVSKEGFEHYMLKEIFEQPAAIRRAYQGRISVTDQQINLNLKSITKEELCNIRRITLLGCGTSWHAACIASSLLEEKAKIPARAEIASEFRYRNPVIDRETLFVAISQSGETQETISAVREARDLGAKVLGICNVPHSRLTQEVDDCLMLHAGPEVSVCSTKAFTSQLTLLSLFALFMGQVRGILSLTEESDLLRDLQRLPEYVDEVLAFEERIEEIAARYAHLDRYFFLGRHYMQTTAMECALKLKEIAYVNATGYASGEMKHGPIALVCPELLAVGLCGNRRTYEKHLSNLLEVKARGGLVVAIAPQGANELKQIANDILWMPADLSDEMASIPYAVAGQLLAYHIAKKRGIREIDRPRNLAKSLTVE